MPWIEGIAGTITWRHQNISNSTWLENQGPGKRQRGCRRWQEMKLKIVESKGTVIEMSK